MFNESYSPTKQMQSVSLQQYGNLKCLQSDPDIAQEFSGCSTVTPKRLLAVQNNIEIK